MSTLCKRVRAHGESSRTPRNARLLWVISIPNETQMKKSLIEYVAVIGERKRHTTSPRGMLNRQLNRSKAISYIRSWHLWSAQDYREISNSRRWPRSRVWSRDSVPSCRLPPRLPSQVTRWSSRASSAPGRRPPPPPRANRDTWELVPTPHRYAVHGTRLIPCRFADRSHEWW